MKQLVCSGVVKQYKSGFKTLVRLPHSTIEIKWFQTLEEAKKRTEQAVFRDYGGHTVRWEKKVQKCGGLRK